MRKALVIVGVVLILLGVSGCTKDGLVVWSFTDELGEMINGTGSNPVSLYYKKAFPDAKIRYSMTPTEQFPSRLDPVLQSGRGAPDVFALESAFVRKYVESGHLLDITDVYERNKSKLLDYPVQVGSYEGKVYAMSWQAAPGAFFYRRSLATKYLGTDDPATVQTYFTDLNKFLETASLLKGKSDGVCVVVSSLGDLQFPFYSARQDPWVVNGRLVIDPVLNQYMDIAKTLHDNRWEGRVGQWSEGWAAGMNGSLRDESGNPVEVFGYFLPTWGLHYVLKNNATNASTGVTTAGDWAMVPGPVPYRWGGTWVGAWKGTKNPEQAKQLIEWVTTNDDFLTAWALEKGDLVSNMDVVNRIKDDFREEFLGGQNHYAEFAEMALEVNGRLTQGTDDDIQALFQEALNAFVNGEKTRDQALADFRQQVQSQLGLN